MSIAKIWEIQFTETIGERKFKSSVYVKADERTDVEVHALELLGNWYGAGLELADGAEDIWSPDNTSCTCISNITDCPSIPLTNIQKGASRFEINTALNINEVRNMAAMFLGFGA